MDHSTLAIASIAWGRDPQEEALLTRSLSLLAQQGLPMFLTDAGSKDHFVQGLESLPHTTVLGPVKGVWPQARTSLKAAVAGGAEWIFYAEPDKAAFFTEHFPLMRHKVGAGDPPGVIIASRSAEGFGSFPHFQQITETTINRCCAELIGVYMDYIYGPFLLHRSLVPYLDSLPDNIGWGWRSYAFLVAHRLGQRVEAFSGDFFCPEDQRQDNRAERVYRMRQMAQNMEGLALAEVADLATGHIETPVMQGKY